MIFLSVSVREENITLPESILKYINETKSATLLESRRLAYSLLYSSLERLFNGIDAEIVRDEGGKPHARLADGRRLFISLSHTDNISAVAISDEREVGVDIEGEIDAERAERIERRFLRDIPKSPLEILGNTPLPTPILRGEPLTVTELKDKDEESSNVRVLSVTDRWVICEAAMKCEGGGFGSLSRVGAILAESSVGVYRISADKKEYSLALVVR